MMAELHDIVMIDGVEHIVSEIKEKSTLKTIPLQDFVIMHLVIKVNDEYITLRELIDREMENIRCLQRQ